MVKWDARATLARGWSDPVWSKVIATGITAFVGAVATFIYFLVQGYVWPKKPVTEAPTASAPAVRQLTEPQKEPDPRPSVPEPNQPSQSSQNPRREQQRTPASPRPIPSPEVVPGDPGCPVAEPMTPPNVVLEEGDLVVAGGTGLFRLDDRMKETQIASGDYLAQSVRGIAVEPDGQILVTTIACRQGAVVRVDPKTGRQTPVMRGFRVTMGIAVEPGGTVLVADENPGNGEFGRLYRLNLATREKGALYAFQTSEAAKTLMLHPSGIVYYTAGDVYPWDGNRSRRLSIEGLTNAYALTVTPQGDLYAIGYNSGSALQVNPGSSTPLRVIDGFSTMSTWSLATSREGRFLFVASGGGDSGRITRANLADATAAHEEVWKGRPGGLGVFVARVGNVER